MQLDFNTLNWFLKEKKSHAPLRSQECPLSFHRGHGRRETPSNRVVLRVKVDTAVTQLFCACVVNI